MRHGSTVTGKRRIAFATYADAGRLPGLLTQLRGLALSNPTVCEDVLLLHSGLDDAALDAARRLHPRIVPRATAGAEANGSGNAPDLLALLGPDGDPDYDTVVALPPGVPVRRDVGPLLRTRRPVVPFEPDGEPPEPAPGEEPGDAPTAADGIAERDFYAAYCALPGGKSPDLLLHCARPLLAGNRPRIRVPGGRALDSAVLARTVGLALHQLGRYAEAVEVLAPAAGDPRRSRLQEAYGSALMAVSRYDEARTHLLLAAADPAVAPRAYTQLAKISWLHGADREAHGHTRLGLDADPTDATLRSLHRRTLRTPSGAGDQEPDPDSQVAHVALFATGRDNAGDKVLPEAVRRCFGPEIGRSRWHRVPVHRLVNRELLDQLNARRGVIVGGGGLFLPDTWPNGNSGWQWNIPDAMLPRITAPLAIFAVGFNVFDGQHFSASRLGGSLRAVVEHAAFFGLRNRGSVARVRDLLPAELRDRVRFQPCPTTVLRHLVPDWQDPTPAERSDVILLNCAYDRAGLRFGHDYGHFLGQMAEAVRRLGRHGEVRYAPHSPSDERFVHDLRREHGLTIPVEPLYDLPNDRLLDVYRTVRLVIGMRGHATMIPFGCGTPAISLISHPKMAYFLADVDRPEWGVSVHETELADRLTERATALLDDHEAAVADVHDRQRDLLRVTAENAGEVAARFGLPEPPVTARPGPRSGDAVAAAG
ncbi:polysaccharide pyruvyl transferase family protein [Streptomyces sp. B6B3]|uniref:polysaccharide pyruvyl transferase family protein n=1 Tax=Streptomyces sp. B6B3 TaxID=3153570 RepID=UPI00325CAF60